MRAYYSLQFTQYIDVLILLTSLNIHHVPYVHLFFLQKFGNIEICTHTPRMFYWWSFPSALKLQKQTAKKQKNNEHITKTQSPLNSYCIWYNTLLTGLHHSPVVSIPLLLLWNSTILPFHLPLPFSFPSLRARKLAAIIIKCTETFGCFPVDFLEKNKLSCNNAGSRNSGFDSPTFLTQGSNPDFLLLVLL